LTALTSLLAEFDLWPGRRALLHPRFVELDDGWQAVIDGPPRSMSRLWLRLGGGQAAADRTRDSAVAAIAAACGLPRHLFEIPSRRPGFFLERQLEVLIGKLPRPLERRTARNLWALRFGELPIPEEGEAAYWSVDEHRLAARFGSALWTQCRNRGRWCWVWYPGEESRGSGECPTPDAVGTLIVCGQVGHDELRMVDRWVQRQGCSAAAIGSFPPGWNPPPPPGFVADRLHRHLALTGLTLDRGRREVERRNGSFEPFSQSERSALTEAARWLWEVPKEELGNEANEGLIRILSLRPEGVPEGFVLVHDGRPAASIRRHARRLGAVIENGRWRLPNHRSLRPDPLHGEAAGLFEVDDPRHLLHIALATGESGELERWARQRLADLDGSSVCKVLSTLSSGALGSVIHSLFVEAMLTELDVAGARLALRWEDSVDLKPWRSWLEVADARRGYIPDLPTADQIRVAPRASAEVALFLLRREIRAGSGGSHARRCLIASCDLLDGAVRRRFELELAALCAPQSLEDREWRTRIVGDNAALRRRYFHLRALQLAHQGRGKAARRLLALAAVGESSAARRALLQLDLGYLALDDGHSSEAGLHLLRAARLLQAAGFSNRHRIVLFNLAVTDLDQLRVREARSRLAQLQDDEDPFVAGERGRLALAEGDEATFRYRLARYPMDEAPRDQRFCENASLLRGVAALLSRDLTTAERLLSQADDEGRAWLTLARALSGERAIDCPRDGWGVHHAVKLVSLLRRGLQAEARDYLPTPDRLRVQESFALALTERLLGRQVWIDRALRKRATEQLSDSGMSGWGWVLQSNPSADIRLIDLLVRVVDLGSPLLMDEESSQGLIELLGVEGLEARSSLSGQLLWRWGHGTPGPESCGVRVVLTPLGGVPADEGSWRLTLGLLDLLAPDRISGELPDDEDTGFHGNSPAIQRLRRELGEFAPTGVGVLLIGETGVGKEVAARALHRLSDRRGRFVPVNVAAVPVELLEAELFGSVRGAYTGADRNRRGLVDAADGGTLFLDEIGDLELPLQVKLLRFLESMEVRPIGSDEFHSVDIRVVSATHHDLERRTAEGSFRHDLYYRIAAAQIRVPPLRERREDIAILKSEFAADLTAQGGLKPCRWSAEVDRCLRSYAWPGNVRELRHVVEVAMIRAAGGTVLAEHLPLAVPGEELPRRWDEAMADFRQRFLTAALSRHGGNRSAAARELGVSRQTLLYHIRNLGL
jgi:transcriptional regulator with AAA-type ATPase domain